MALMRSEMRAVLCSSSLAIRSISRRVPKRVSSGPSEAPAAAAKNSSCVSVKPASASNGASFQASATLRPSSQLFSLLLFPCDVSNAVRQQSHEPLRKLGHALEQLRELGRWKRQRASRKYSTPGHTNRFHSGKRQDPCYIPGTGSKDGAILRAVLAPGPEFTLQDHQHGVRRTAFLDDDSTDFDTALLRLGNKPFQIGLLLIRERRDFP